MNNVVNDSTFGLKGKRACISGQRNKERYLEYQNNYRMTYGVFPELDRINNPYIARLDDVYKLCCDLKKAGVYGALYYHDLHNRYRRGLIRIYEKYSWEWSFLLSVGPSYRQMFYEIPSIPPSENIVGNLGYRKDYNGNYYEGTWQNGVLVYGFVYLAAQERFYVGSFDETGMSDCCGVAVDISNESKNKCKVATTVGTFRVINGEILLYNSECLVNVATIKGDDLVSLDSDLGRFVEGYVEGMCISKEFSDNIRIRWDKYKDGEITSSMSSLESLPRTLMMFYMLFWFLVKYVHLSVVFVTPLYYILKKKNWKL